MDTHPPIPESLTSAGHLPGPVPPSSLSSTLSSTSPSFIKTAEEIAATAQWFSLRGWTPATSTNFSCRLPGSSDGQLLVAITRSGIDKAFCAAEDILMVNELGQVIPPFYGKSSAETPLHLAIYKNLGAGAVLHTHSVLSTVLSMHFASQEKVVFQNFEILKGLAGVETHEVELFIPIFPNTQDMDQLGRDVAKFLLDQQIEQTHKRVFGVLIEGHGLYAWGKNLAEAKRHIEVYEFLFESKLKLMQLSSLSSNFAS